MMGTYGTLGTLIERRPLAQDHTLLRFHLDTPLAEAAAGQFVEIGVGLTLNRAFGVAVQDDTTLTIGVKAVGAGSRRLCGAALGQTFPIYGPFGHGFVVSDRAPAIVVGGGTGVYPLLRLCQTLHRRGLSGTLVLGFRSRHDALWLDTLASAGLPMVVAFEHGGGGDVNGTVIDAMTEVASHNVPAVVYACGPIPMLAAINRWCDDHSVDGFFSFEAHMGCGYGVCRGCAIPVHGERAVTYDRCCVEGPVFARRRIAWEAFA